ncbi:MAG TPA: hypothetical protein VKT77_19125, partial [Chthonomonadaceae bacterium]|nr:hypothetical protein [Chthonomonadaceae bacterium]
MRTELTTLLLLSFAVGCAAQQPPPVGTTDAGSPAQQTPPPKAGAKQQSAAGQDKSKQPPADAPDTPAEPESPKPQKSRLAPPSTLYIDAGYGDWGLSGNASKLRQYATPPHGLFLRNLRYSPILRTPSTSAFFDVKGLGQDDYRAETRLVWGYGETLASAFSSRFRFLDPLANQVGSSSRLVQGFKGSQALARDFALSFQYRFDTQHNNYAAPFDNLNQETQFWDASAAGKLGRGFGAVTFSDLQYADHTGSRLDSTTQTVALSYLWNLSSAVDVEAEYRHAGIRQPSLSDSHVEVVSLKGDVALGPSTDLNVRLQQRNLALPNVQSAYVRGQGLGMASLFHRWKSWRAQVGVRLQEDERVNASHTFVDVPKWSTVEGRLSGRLLDGWRLTLRGYAQTLSDPPVAATDDPASLYWTSRNFFEARLEGGPPDISYYLVYTFQNNRNSA